MNLEVHYREMASTEAIKTHIEDRAQKLEKHVADDQHVTVIVGAKNKGHRHFAEVLWHCSIRKKDFFAKDEGDDLYTQIESVFDKVTHQLQKGHERNLDSRDHRAPLKKAGNGNSPI